MVEDLVQWLGKQLDEDERIAQSAGGRSEQVWEADLSGKDPLGMPSWPIAVRYTTDGRMRGAVANLPVMNERSEDRMVHIAAHDPARVLREIHAKRGVIARLQHLSHDDNPFVSSIANDSLRELAEPYADRPGYREEWRP